LRGSSLTSNANLTLSAGKDITVAASQVEAQGATRLGAAGTVNITTEQEQHTSAAAHSGSGGNFLRSKASAERNTSNTSLAAGSSIGGSTVVVNAGQDINVKGSSVIADTGTTLVASRDINITAGENTSQQTSFAEKNESGFLSGGGLGITYKQVGSDVLAPGGDINIVARKVDIIEARETSGADTETKFKQSGVTLQITSPVLSALQTVNQMSQAAANTSDGRMKALAGANMAFAANNAANAIQAGQGSTLGGKEGQIATFDDKGNPTGSRDASAADQVGGINLALSIGSSSSQSNSKSQSDTARGSSVTAGGNVAIIATGGGQDSNLTIQGRTVEAGKSALLLADNQIKLLAATNQASQQSSNTSSAGSIGISYGTDGLLLNLSASKGRGKAHGKDTSYTNTQIKGGNGPGDTGNSVTLQSGGDTILQGAVIAANQVRADVGGNLSIESLQDSSTYTRKQQNVGGSLSIGYGNMSGSLSASKSSVNSNFNSVAEQSGIKAGGGGFEVSVKGNTDLKGAVIASTDKAVNEARNTFATGGTSTASDIKNSASFEGKSVGISIGAGQSAKTASIQGVGAGIGSDKGNASSTTPSGISGMAANTAVRSTDAQTGIARIFDADKVQKEINAQVVITQAFGRDASKAVSGYAQSQNRAEASAKSSGISLGTDMLSQGKYGVAKAVLGNALDNAGQSGNSSGKTKSAVSAGIITITDETAQQASTGKTAAQTVASLNRDSATAHAAAKKQDVQAMQQTVEAERVIKAETVRQAGVVSDAVYRSHTGEKKILLQRCDGQGQNCQSKEVPADQIVPGADGKIYIFNHGIMNNEQQALESAARQSSPEAIRQGVYVVINPHTGSPVAEVVYAAWDKLLSPALGISNAAQANIDIVSSAARQGEAVEITGHSRGGITIENATGQMRTDGLTNVPIANVQMSGSAGNAQNVQRSIDQITSGRGVPGQVNQSTHQNDWVGTLIGRNPPTGGLPSGLVGAHGSYGSNAEPIRSEPYWGPGQRSSSTPANQTPAP
jgi:hypothetical protein